MSPISIQGMIMVSIFWKKLSFSFMYFLRKPFSSSSVFHSASVLSCFSSVWLCETLYSPPGCSVHEILQARILKWVAISFSRGPSWPRDQTWGCALVGGFFTTEPPGKSRSLSAVRVKVKLLSCVRLFVTPWTVAYQAPLIMDFPGKGTGVGCHFLL